MKKSLFFTCLLLAVFLQAQVRKKTEKKKIEKEWINPVKLTKEERSRPYMDEVLKTRDSLTPKEAERRRKNILAGNPFAKYGYYPKVATLSRGKYLEFHDKDSIVVIGSIKYNTKQQKVIEVLDIDLSDPDAQPVGDTHGMWMSPDPLSEEFPSWSPYVYAFQNPLRNVDPTGLAPEDIIKILNNGKIERTVDNNSYDTITNEDGSKSIQIARTNVSGSNPRGDSQIGNMKSLPFELPASQGLEGSASSTYSYLQIQNYDAATQFFEFAAENTKVEFSQDTFNFSDGYSTSIISTNHSVNQSISAGIMLQPYSFGGNIIQDGTHTENVHSHPGAGDYAPSGYAALFINGTVSYGINPFHGTRGDKGIPQVKGLTRYMYSPSLNKRLGGGYVQYDNKNATYKGRVK